MKLLICFILALASLTAADEPPQSGTWSRFGISTTYRSWKDAPAAPARKPAAGSNSRCTSCARDARGRIARSAAARRQFQRENPCPSNGRKTGACPGYVVDHIVALKHGGSDEPANMQWQTATEAGTKGKIE